ncbi:MAG: amino acid ABC transporter substrate-binding protein [Deinococcus sp.]|nr:amino acid ABC transporter substrate-binding protein [Deinococcus sp.]
MRLLYFALALVLTLSLSFAPARPLAQVRESGTLLIGTEGAFPPFNNLLPDGRIVGFDVEIGQAIANVLGLDSEVVTLSFPEGLLNGLAQGEIDVAIAAFGYTDERAQVATYTKSYAVDPVVIVTRSDDADLAGIESIQDVVDRGGTFGVQQGTTFITNLLEPAGVTDFLAFATDPEATAALIAGQTDAWITNGSVASNAVAANPTLQIASVLGGEALFILTAKPDLDLASAVDLALEVLIADGRYSEISVATLGADITDQVRELRASQ